MSDGDRTHKLELRIQALESRFGVWRSVAFGVIAFLGLGTAYSLYDLYNRTLDEAERAVFEQARGAIGALVETAEADAAKVRAAANDACHDPRWIEKTGRCIYSLLPAKRYSLNYGAAAALCAARGARLCTLAEVRAAHKAGAEWCQWSWVADVARASRDVTGDGATNVFDVTGVIAFPTQGRRSGCGQDMNVQTGQNLITRNAGATCCM